MTRVLEGSLRAAGTVQNLFSPKASWAVEYKHCRTTGHGSTPRIVNRMDKGPVTKPTAQPVRRGLRDAPRVRSDAKRARTRVPALRHDTTATRNYYCLLSTPTSKV